MKLLPPKRQAVRMIIDFTTTANYRRTGDQLWHACEMASKVCDYIIDCNPYSNPTSSGEIYSMEKYWKEVKQFLIIYRKESNATKKLPRDTRPRRKGPSK